MTPACVEQALEEFNGYWREILQKSRMNVIRARGAVDFHCRDGGCDLLLGDILAGWRWRRRGCNGSVHLAAK